MSSFGVTSTGFVIKTVQDLLDDIEAGEKSAFGSDINVAADSVFGQLNGVFAGSLAEAWELAQGVYSAQYPNSANDAALDNVAAITGVVRLAATQSTALLTCTGTPGVVLLAGRVVSHSVSGDRFTTDADATLVAATAWAATTAYAVDDIVTNSSNIYVCVVAGTSAGAGGPTGETAGIVDGTVTWDFVGTGAAFAVAAATAEQFGPIAAPAGALTVIETPVAQWSSVKNLLDAIQGSDIETDADFRLRRDQSLALQGSATLNAIVSDLGTVDGVLSAFVFENATEFADAEDRPPHSIEAVVSTTTGDTPDAVIDQAVADKLFESKAAGIETFGFPGRIVTKTVVDDTGTSHTVNWTRVDEIEIYVEIDLVVNTNPSVGPSYPLDGDDQVKAAIVAAGDGLTPGQDIIAEFFKCQAFSVTGVIDVTDFKIDTIAVPVNTGNIALTDRQLGVFDTSRVTVVS